MQNQEMCYCRVGKSNLTVSALCLGAMMFGDQAEAAKVRRIVADACNIGGDLYTQGATA